MGRAGYAKVARTAHLAAVAERMAPTSRRPLRARLSRRRDRRGRAWRTVRPGHLVGLAASTCCARSTGPAPRRGGRRELEGARPPGTGREPLSRSRALASSLPLAQLAAEPAAPDARSALGARAPARAHTEADGVFQIGAWYDLAGAAAALLLPRWQPRRLAGPRPEPRLDRHDRGGATGARGRAPPLRPAATLIFTDERLAAPLVRGRLRPGAGEGDHRRRRRQSARRVPEAPERTFESPRVLFVGKRWERKGGPQLLEAFRRGYGTSGPTRSSGSSGPRSRRRRSRGALPSAVSTALARGRAPPGRALSRRDGRSRCPRSTSRSGSSSSRRWPTGFPASGATAARCRRSSTTASPATVDAFDTEALARRLLELAEPDRARAFGEAGHRRFLERFTWDGSPPGCVDAVTVSRERWRRAQARGEPELADRELAADEQDARGRRARRPAPPTQPRRAPTGARSRKRAGRRPSPPRPRSERTSDTPSGPQRRSSTARADPEMRRARRPRARGRCRSPRRRFRSAG